jgi:hypothetical protein
MMLNFPPAPPTPGQPPEPGNFGPAPPTGRDIVVCSYYKSGTNWALQIAVHIHDLVPWPEAPEHLNSSVSMNDESPWQNSPTGLRVIKSHLPANRIPYVESARYLCVVRDPKDVLISSFHFTKATLLGPRMPTLAAWLDAFLSPMALFGSWAVHASGFWKMRHLPNVLFVTYEQMHADLPDVVDRVAALARVGLEAGQRNEVLRRSSFEYMKSIESCFDPRVAMFPWSQTRGTMMRSGKRGSGSAALSAAESKRIDDHFRAELLQLGCDLPYDRLFLQHQPRTTASI